jgi:hypothetical protein
VSLIRISAPPPEWLRQEIVREPRLSCFLDTQKFQDDVHGQVLLSPLERDLVDTPEFRRLFRLSQLGFVTLVFPTANHSRGVHSIGVCATAKEFIQIVNSNTRRVAHERGEDQAHTISFTSSVLMSIGALLHDISHGPFSHDIEKKKHYILLSRRRGDRYQVLSHYGPYERHDDYEHHPVLFISLMQHETSVLARALRAYSPLFWELMNLEMRAGDTELKDFVTLAKASWPNVEREVLPALLFHLLVFEKYENPMPVSQHVSVSFEGEDRVWGLGPQESWNALHEAWYQPYRHDIIGDTVSADLFDYLLRDLTRLGIPRRLDPRLLEFYVLAPIRELDDTRERFRCAIDLNDYKRGTPRIDLVNEIFRLLDLRFEIHEKAVFHRVVQSAIAMTARCLGLLGTRKPRLKELYVCADTGSPALASEDVFLNHLVAVTDGPVKQSIAQKIVERRVYRPLIVMPGDQIANLFAGMSTDFEEKALRELAALVDSRYYSEFICFMSWCIENILQHGFHDVDDLRSYIDRTRRNDVLLSAARQRIPRRVIFSALPYKQLHKDPKILIRVGVDKPCYLDDLIPEDDGEELHDRPSLRKRIRIGLENASTKYESLWKLFVFVSDGLYFTGVLAKTLKGHPCGGADAKSMHREHLKSAQALVVETLRAVWNSWKAEGPTKPLESSCSREDFLSLLEAIALPGPELTYQRPTTIAQRISAVAVDQYLHEDARDDPKFGVPERCRDARYKFGRTGEDVFERALRARDDLAADSKTWFRDLFDGLNSTWTEDELDELIVRLQTVPSRVVDPRPFHEMATDDGNWKWIQAVWREEDGWEEAWKR